MTTVTSARGLLLIWTSFLTGLFVAYCWCGAERFINARMRAALPPKPPIVVEKIYESRTSGVEPIKKGSQGG
ncbi:MAG: hypothetical protein ABUL60_21230 [Myxococcales bacterium]